MIMPSALDMFVVVCQGGGAATQLPAEQYHSGSNPDLGFL